MPIAVGIIIAWVGTAASIPTNWSRVTSLDARYVKQIPNNSTNPGGTGGATTHTHPFTAHLHSYGAHTHAGSWGNSDSYAGGPPDGFTLGAYTNQTGHVHPSTGAASASLGNTSNNSAPTNGGSTPSDPALVTVIFIQSNGSANGIPVNGIVWFNETPPTGFSAYAALDNRIMKGAITAGDGGTQAGSDAHTHGTSHDHAMSGSHTHSVSLDGVTGSQGGTEPTFLQVSGTHSHTVGNDPGTANPTVTDSGTETSGTGDMVPPWQKMRACQKTGVPAEKRGMIAIWLGTLVNVPSRWRLCDGGGGTPNLCQGRYTRGAVNDGEIGNTGGATTHTHAASAGHVHTSVATHSHSLTAQSSTFSANDSRAQDSGSGILGSHFHNGTYTAPATGIGNSSSVATTQVVNTSNDPLHTEVAFVQLITEQGGLPGFLASD